MSDYVIQVPKTSSLHHITKKREKHQSFSIQCWILSMCHHLCPSVLLYTLRETPSFSKLMEDMDRVRFSQWTSVIFAQSKGISFSSSDLKRSLSAVVTITVSVVKNMVVSAINIILQGQESFICQMAPMQGLHYKSWRQLHIKKYKECVYIRKLWLKRAAT